MQRTDTGSAFTPVDSLFAEYTFSILFQFSETQGGQLMNGIVDLAPFESGTAGDLSLVAISSQDISVVNDPNGALALITFTDD